jgi:chromosome segregation ATPase
MAEGIKPPSTMKVVSPAERQRVKQQLEARQERGRAVSVSSPQLFSPAEKLFAKQLQDEQQARTSEVRALWARLEELDQQVQVCKTQSQVASPLPLPLPTQTHVRSEVSRLEERMEERVRALTDQISESQARFKGSPETMHAPSMAIAELAASVARLETGLKDLDVEHQQFAKELASIAELQIGLQDLDTKHVQLANQMSSVVALQTGQLAKDLSSVKGVLKELDMSMNISAIRTSRIALQATSLSMDERNQALAALDKKEHECLNTQGISGSAMGYTSQI